MHQAQHCGAEDAYLDMELPQAPLEEPRVRGEGDGSHLCKHMDTTASAFPPPAPASFGATFPSTHPGLNILTGPEGLGVKHLPWLGTQRDVDVGTLFPWKAPLNTPEDPARVSCKPFSAGAGSHQRDAETHLLPMPPSLSSSSDCHSNSVFLLRINPRSCSLCRGSEIYWRAAAIYGCAQKSQGKDWDR